MKSSTSKFPFSVNLRSTGKKKKKKPGHKHYLLYFIPSRGNINLLLARGKNTFCSHTILKAIYLWSDLCECMLEKPQWVSFWVLQTSKCAQLWNFFVVGCLLLLRFILGGTQYHSFISHPIQGLDHKSWVMNLLHSESKAECTQ